MALTLADLKEVREEQTILLPPRPLTFDEFVEMFGEDDDVELVDGMVVRRMAAQDHHEDLHGWLLTVLRVYVHTKDLGIVRGSRTPVRITEHRCRLPDLVFVRKDRKNIVRERGIYGAPDLVVEIVSPDDRPAHLLALDLDYRTLGVAEIWFVDPKRKQVRVLRKRNGDYQERITRKGVLRSEVVEGFWLKTEWLFAEPLPQELIVLRQLLGEPLFPKGT